MMEKEEILEKLKEFVKKNSNPDLYGYRENSWESIDPKDDPSSLEFEGFRSDSWTVGGMSGGNCWGDKADRPVPAEEPLEITRLDEFLAEFMPSITYLQYKKISQHIHHKEFSRNEYYGNYSDMRFSYIRFNELAETLANLEIDLPRKRNHI